KCTMLSIVRTTCQMSQPMELVAAPRVSQSCSTDRPAVANSQYCRTRPTSTEYWAGIVGGLPIPGKLATNHHLWPGLRACRELLLPPCAGCRVELSRENRLLRIHLGPRVRDLLRRQVEVIEVSFPGCVWRPAKRRLDCRPGSCRRFEQL